MVATQCFLSLRASFDNSKVRNLSGFRKTNRDVASNSLGFMHVHSRTVAKMQRCLELSIKKAGEFRP